jgi:hypothetical protein
MHTPTLLAGAGLALLLSACGGSSGPDPVVPPPVAAYEVPASAFASAEAFTRYAASLPPSDTTEPLALGTAAAPTSDTDEPREI